MSTSVQPLSEKKRLLRRYTSMMTLPTTLAEHSVLSNETVTKMSTVQRSLCGSKPPSHGGGGKSRWRKLSLTGIVQRLGRSSSSASSSRSSGSHPSVLGSDGASLTHTPPTSGSPDNAYAWFSLCNGPPRQLQAPQGYRYASDGRLVYSSTLRTSSGGERNEDDGELSDGEIVQSKQISPICGDDVFIRNEICLDCERMRKVVF